MDNDYDSIVLATIDEIKARAKVGKNKYWTDLDRTDLHQRRFKMTQTKINLRC